MSHFGLNRLTSKIFKPIKIRSYIEKSKKPAWYRRNFECVGRISLKSLEGSIIDRDFNNLLEYRSVCI